MTFRSFILWLIGIVAIGALAYLVYIYLINPATSKVNTEASFDGVATLAIPRSGIIDSYNPETNELSFYESESGALEMAIVDETTVIRQVVGGVYTDTTTDALQADRFVSITLESTTVGAPVSALDVSEVTQ